MVTYDHRFTLFAASDAAYWKSDEYQTSRSRDYYPKKPPPGLQLPRELATLGSLKDEVLSMPDADLDKNVAYSNKAIKALQKKIVPRIKSEGDDAIQAELLKIDHLKEEMATKMMDAKSDAEADPYRFAARKLLHTWRAYNAAFADIRDEVEAKARKQRLKGKKINPEVKETLMVLRKIDLSKINFEAADFIGKAIYRLHRELDGY